MRRLMLLPLALVTAVAILPAALPAAAAAPPAPTRDITKILNAERGATSVHPFMSLATSAVSYTPLRDVYPVGKTMGSTVDRARGVAKRAPLPASSVRSLPISIWYPAASGAISSGDTFRANSRRGQFPLIVFAAGFNASPETYQPFLHAIAAQGYIVAAPLFPIEGAIAGAAAASRSNAEILNQMYDMSAVITQMLAYSTTSGNWLSVAMVKTQIAVIGHSDGAMTVAGMTMSTSYSDSRIKAAAVLSGAGPLGLTWNTRKVVPLMVEQATQDPYNAPANSQWLFNHVTGPRDYLTVTGPYHIWPFIGNDRVADVVRRAVIAQLDSQLKNGGTAAFWRLAAAANTAGLTSLRFAT
jgi:hypothetical protein